MKVDSLERVELLEGLARRIRTHHDEACAAGVLFKKAFAEMRSGMLLCGQALREAKVLVGHGGFGAWVEKHCGFTQRTAQNYMALAVAKTKEVSHLPDSLSAKVVKLLQRAVGRLQKFLPDASEIGAWPEEDRAALRLVVDDLYQRLGGPLASVEAHGNSGHIAQGHPQEGISSGAPDARG